MSSVFAALHSMTNLETHSPLVTHTDTLKELHGLYLNFCILILSTAPTWARLSILK